MDRADFAKLAGWKKVCGNCVQLVATCGSCGSCGNNSRPPTHRPSAIALLADGKEDTSSVASPPALALPAGGAFPLRSPPPCPLWAVHLPLHCRRSTSARRPNFSDRKGGREGGRKGARPPKLCTTVLLSGWGWRVLGRRLVMARVMCACVFLRHAEVSFCQRQRPHLQPAPPAPPPRVLSAGPGTASRSPRRMPCRPPAAWPGTAPCRRGASCRGRSRAGPAAAGPDASTAAVVLRHSRAGPAVGRHAHTKQSMLCSRLCSRQQTGAGPGRQWTHTRARTQSRGGGGRGRGRVTGGVGEVVPGAVSIRSGRT